MQRRAEIQPFSNDLRLAHADDGSPYRYARFGFCTDVDRLLKRCVKLGTTIGITGRIFGDRADVDCASVDNFTTSFRQLEQSARCAV